MSTFMIVDDASFMRGALRHIVEAAGHRVVGEADNGEDALALYRELRPDVVTLDILMPGLDGLDTLDALKAEWPEARVVMVSALDHEEKRHDAERLGAAGFIRKPFRQKDVVEELERVVRGPGTTGPAREGPGAAITMTAITDKQRDFLGELMNVGSGSAATALARILGTPVSMEIPPPRAWPDAAPTLLEELGARPVTCAAMETTGDVPGVLLFLIPEGSRKALTERLSGGLSGPPDQTEAARAAVDDARIRDVADIVSGVFLTATQRFCGLAIHHSAPVVTMGEGPALLRKELAGVGGGDAPGLLIEARFTASSQAMRVHMLVAPRPEGLEALAGSLEHALSICLE
jgi:two-component system chemotaxis response regulator CheY